MWRLHSAGEILTRLRTITSPLITDANFLRYPGHRELFLSVRVDSPALLHAKPAGGVALRFRTAEHWKCGSDPRRSELGPMCRAQKIVLLQVHLR